jgi:guanylate kinase
MTEHMTKKAKLYIIAAPSGTGKTSLVDALVNSADDLQLSISHTTRNKREGEKEGEHYHFVSREQFEGMMADDAFLEHAEVYGNFYGTSREWVEKTLAQGNSVILEIDWQGAQQIRQHFPKSMSIFILPPSREALEKRLRARQQDDEGTIQRRMQALQNEVVHYDEFDYLMVNDDFDYALDELKQVAHSEKTQAADDRQAYMDLVKSLLA